MAILLVIFCVVFFWVIRLVKFFRVILEVLFGFCWLDFGFRLLSVLGFMFFIVCGIEFCRRLESLGVLFRVWRSVILLVKDRFRVGWFFLDSVVVVVVFSFFLVIDVGFFIYFFFCLGVVKDKNLYIIYCNFIFYFFMIILYKINILN